MPAPLIIHQIWLQGWDKVPAHLLENVNQVIAMNPDYEHKKWDDAGIRALCQKLGSEYLQRYDSFEYLMSKVDYGRYVILYCYGGISLDTDMKSLKPLSACAEIHEHDLLISRAAFPYGQAGLVNNALIITTPQHPFLRQVIDAIASEGARESDYPTKEVFVQFSSGPQFMNRMCRHYDGKIYYLDNKYFEPCLSMDPLCKVPTEAIMDHQHELSWMGPMAKIFMRMVFFLLYFGIPILGLLVVGAIASAKR